MKVVMVVNVIGKEVEYVRISCLKLRVLCIYNYVYIFEKEIVVIWKIV